MEHEIYQNAWLQYGALGLLLSILIFIAYQFYKHLMGDLNINKVRIEVLEKRVAEIQDKNIDSVISINKSFVSLCEELCELTRQSNEMKQSLITLIKK